MTCLCSGFGPARRFTDEEAKVIGDNLGINWQKINLDQFRLGLEHELEHGCRSPQVNVTCDDPLLTGKIALAHLKEMPDYYSQLKTIEKPLWERKELEDLKAMR